MILTVSNVGQIGVIKDTSSENIPTNAWTDAYNMQFYAGSAAQSNGWIQIYNPPSVIPYHVLPVTISDVRYWIYVGLAKVYCVNGTTHTDLSPGGAYSGAQNKWNSCVLGGIPIINAGNTTDLPQSWDLNLAHTFGALANWPAATYCRSMRAFKNYLVALYITKPGGTYPFMVKWSHKADPGAVPSSWDQTDATKSAGEYDLSQGEDVIVDGLQLRSSFMIYRESSIWRMDEIGGDYVMSFTKVLGQTGALTKNCIAEVDGAHFIMTGDDFIMHDGNSPVSVLDKTNRRALFNDMDGTNYKNTYVLKNPYMSEVMVCYPSLGSTICDKALVYNYREKTISYKHIPNTAHGACGLVESTVSTSWDSDTSSWNSDVTKWDQLGFTPDASRVVFAGASETKLYLLDADATANGNQVAGYIERRGLHFDEPEKIKFVKKMRARIIGNIGATVFVKVAGTDTPYDDPVYTGWAGSDTSKAFTIGSTETLDFNVTGRYISIRFESGSALQWKLDSFDIEYELMGEW